MLTCQNVHRHLLNQPCSIIVGAFLLLYAQNIANTHFHGNICVGSNYVVPSPPIAQGFSRHLGLVIASMEHLCALITLKYVLGTKSSNIETEVTGLVSNF